MRFSKAELSTLKHVFAENYDLLFAIRKVFLQFEITEAESVMIHAALVGKPEVFAVLSKTFLPVIDPTAPIHQIVDLWMTIDIKDKTPDVALAHIIARQSLIDYLAQQLNRLSKVGTSDKSDDPIRFADFVRFEGKIAMMVYADVSTRNTLIAHVEQMISQILMLAGKKDENEDQTLARLRKDSSQ